jgi:hypothetical protein
MEKVVELVDDFFKNVFGPDGVFIKNPELFPELTEPKYR